MPHANRNVLVTGASGFVGSHVVRTFLDAELHVVATTTQLRDDLPQKPNLKWVTWDAERQPLPEVAWAEMASVVHLAMPNVDRSDVSCANRLFDVIALSTQRLLDVAVSNGIPRFLLASTGDVLGGRDEPAFETDTGYSPESFYGTSKACAEILVDGYSTKLSTAVLRFFHPYGINGERFLISKLVERIKAGEVVFLNGPNGIMVNPIWIEELAGAILAATETKESGIFHLGGPDIVSMRELVTLIGEIVGRPPIIKISDEQAARFYCGNGIRSQTLLGHCPTVGLRKGLDMLVNQFNSK